MANVTLTAQLKGFERVGDALKNTATGLKRIGLTAENVSKKLKSVGAGLTSFGRSMSLKVTAPIVAGLGLAVKAMNTQVKAEAQLRASLEATGQATGNTFEEMKRFAAEIQKVTTVGDESTIRLLQVATTMGLNAEQAQRASKNAIGLAKAMGINEQSAIRYTAALEQGDTTMLNRYIPTLRQIEDDSERVAEAQRLMANMFGVAKAEAQTGLGPLTQAWNELGDAMEEVGVALVPLIQQLAGVISQVATAIKDSSPEAKRLAVVLLGVAAAVGPLAIALGMGANGLAFAISALNPITIGLAAVLVGAWAGFITGAKAARVFVGGIKAIQAVLPLLGQSLQRSVEVVKTTAGAFGDFATLLKDVFTKGPKQAWEDFTASIDERTTTVKANVGEIADIVAREIPEAWGDGWDKGTDAVDRALVMQRQMVKDHLKQTVNDIANFALPAASPAAGPAGGGGGGGPAPSPGGVSVNPAMQPFGDISVLEGDLADRHAAIENHLANVRSAQQAAQEAAEESAREWGDRIGSVIHTITGRMADAMVEVANAVADGSESMGQAFSGAMKRMLNDFIQTTTTMIVQQMLFATIMNALREAELLSQLGVDAAETYGGVFASAASALPFPLSIIVPPIVAAGAVATMLAAAKGFAASGMENVPDTGTFVLHRGERVLQREQNRDLSNFLSGRGPAFAGGGGGMVVNINGPTTFADAIQKKRTIRELETSLMRAQRRRAR